MFLLAEIIHRQQFVLVTRVDTYPGAKGTLGRCECDASQRSPFIGMPQGCYRVSGMMKVKRVSSSLEVTSSEAPCAVAICAAI